MNDNKDWCRCEALRVLRDHPLTRGMNWKHLAQKYKFDLDALDDPEGVAPFKAWFGVFEDAAVFAGNDAMMFDIFYDIDVGTFTVFDYLFSCAPTLRESCQSWVNYIRMRNNVYLLSFHETENEGCFEWPIVEGYGAWQQNMFGRIGWAVRKFETAIGDELPPLRIELATERPVKSGPFLDKYADKMVFGQKRNAIILPAELLDRRPVGGDDNLYAILVQAAKQELETRLAENAQLSRIMDAMADSMKLGNYSLNNVAEHMNMSPRSLQRALEAEGTSFRQLSEQFRKGAAERYITETRLPMKEIAYLLGFSEISTFSRAVKTWFGASPRKLRLQT
ncbi:AraC family transcriptional regulator [Roseibium litorale]|uniref:Helix-turn-helix domain-containing protein n=1 Tax=Roseibium litorale TaxID=2803841 RepID=A0ABR9CQR2_9HYPH|nr:AraC family transcriptional regulator [Roseibium litorale]MBD8893164.1 helix-turn-helix domain-containing protein [Roseibium litorale]